jgi:hypothetical protein
MREISGAVPVGPAVPMWLVRPLTTARDEVDWRHERLRD